MIIHKIKRIRERENKKRKRKLKFKTSGKYFTKISGQEIFGKKKMNIIAKTIPKKTKISKPN